MFNPYHQGSLEQNENQDRAEQHAQRLAMCQADLVVLWDQLELYIKHMAAMAIGNRISMC